jgi:hypothetical protein
LNAKLDECITFQERFTKLEEEGEQLRTVGLSSAEERKAGLDNFRRRFGGGGDLLTALPRSIPKNSFTEMFRSLGFSIFVSHVSKGSEKL